MSIPVDTIRTCGVTELNGNMYLNVVHNAGTIIDLRVESVEVKDGHLTWVEKQN